MTDYESIEQRAMNAATLAVRQVIAQSKNPLTTLGNYPPTTVAYHAAWAAITAHQQTYDEAVAEAYREMNAAPFTDEALFDKLWGDDPQ